MAISDLIEKLFSINGWDLSLSKYITLQELESSINAGKLLYIKDLIWRKNNVFCVIRNEIINENDLNKKLYSLGFRIVDEDLPRNHNTIKGTIANKGSAKGKVKIVFAKDQLDKVEIGDILVAPMTTPLYLPAMQKAVAFVTDEGGIVCHAAIVAREMKKPCIVGTKIVTKVLKDNDYVEVDANKGIVKRIKKKKKPKSLNITYY